MFTLNKLYADEYRVSHNTFETFAIFLLTSRNCETIGYHRDSIACGWWAGVVGGEQLRIKFNDEKRIHQRRETRFGVYYTDMQPVIELLLDDDEGNNITKEDRYGVMISDFVWPRLDRTETRGYLRFRLDEARPV